MEKGKTKGGEMKEWKLDWKETYWREGRGREKGAAKPGWDADRARKFVGEKRKAERQERREKALAMD